MLISGQPISSSPISADGIFFIEGTLEVFLFNLNIYKEISIDLTKSKLEISLNINRSQNFTLKTAY